jgi:hypothetical protein
MFDWWQNLESVALVNGWLQVLATAGAAGTVICTFLLWIKGNRMVGHLIDRERNASSRIKAVEKAAEQIRRELLATQQNQDIADQKRRLAEMDADALRKEIEKVRRRYQDAEVTLRDRIDELKDMNITQSSETTQTGGLQKHTLDNQQLKMLVKLLSAGPKGELDIISVLNDTRSNEFATLLKKTFDDQGWNTQGIVQSAFTNPPEGLVLVIHSKQTAPSYAKFLQRTFTTLGMPVTAQINSKFREWSISLIVGRLE